MAIWRVATDRGEFTALTAAYSTDRQGERIVPGAFAKTIMRWQDSGKLIPLHYDHIAAADHILGDVDPMRMRETDEGLYVEGRLDLEDSPLAVEAWRSMKRGRVFLSFGFLATKTRRGPDGTRELVEIDLFEVSVTAAPANPDTRFLSFKSADGISEWELKRRLGLEPAKSVKPRPPSRIASFDA